MTVVERRELQDRGITLYNLALSSFEEAFSDAEATIGLLSSHLRAAQSSSRKGCILMTQTPYVFASCDCKECIKPQAFGTSEDLQVFLFENDGILTALHICLLFATGSAEEKEHRDSCKLLEGRCAGHRIKLIKMETAQKEVITNVSEQESQLSDGQVQRTPQLMCVVCTVWDPFRLRGISFDTVSWVCKEQETI